MSLAEVLAARRNSAAVIGGAAGPAVNINGLSKKLITAAPLLDLSLDDDDDLDELMMDEVRLVLQILSTTSLSPTLLCMDASLLIALACLPSSHVHVIKNQWHPLTAREVLRVCWHVGSEPAATRQAGYPSPPCHALHPR